MESGSSSLSASEQNPIVGRQGQRRRMRIGGESWYGKVKGDGSTKAGCCEPDIGLGSARRVKTHKTPKVRAESLLTRIKAVKKFHLL